MNASSSSARLFSVGRHRYRQDHSPFPPAARKSSTPFRENERKIKPAADGHRRSCDARFVAAEAQTGVKAGLALEPSATSLLGDSSTYLTGRERNCEGLGKAGALEG